MAQVGFKPAPHEWVSMRSRTQIQLTSPGTVVECADFFTFHAYLMSHYDSTTSKSKLFVLIDIHSILTDQPHGLSCSMVIDYDRNSQGFGGGTDSGTWEPTPMELTSVHAQSVLSFSLGTEALASHDSIKLTRVAITVKPINPLRSPLVPLAMQDLRTRALLATMDDPSLCDCALLPNNPNAIPVLVSRAVLAHASPFFVAMFKGGPWAESVKCTDPIAFGWSASATLPCLLHAYSGWLVGQELPDCPSILDVLAKHAVDVRQLTLHQLLELMDLAQMLELPLLVQAVNLQMASELKKQLVKVLGDVVEMFNTAKSTPLE